MAIFKCKMCGAPLTIESGATVIECEYCGTQQTLPKLDDDRRANLYDRANHFRRNNEFDKAMGIYEKILNEDNTDAEAYWSLVLCRYGIEYVEDPISHKRIPTVNRAQFTSIFDDEDYKSALKHADSYQKILYEAEAKAINEIQKGILAISQKEEPFDVFICYKETDASGRRTQDSVLAQDLYYQLTAEGFKVFFARITLEDKLGSAYEPYIFAALNSSKVMVVLGTKPEFFSAVWVKNEWSRYLSLIKQGQKKILIPAYRDMDPYDLPEEFSHLQAQDMSKLGFMQDLIRGIKKLVAKDEPKVSVVKETVVASASSNVAPLLKRAFMFLEDGDWGSANDYCEKVLDIDPENAEAYLGKLMAELRVRAKAFLKNQEKPFDDNGNYQKVLRFGDDKLKNELTGYTKYIKERNEKARLDGIYHRAKNAMNSAQTEENYKEAAKLFASVASYKDSAALQKECLEKAEIVRKDAIYHSAKKKMNGQDIKLYQQAISEFESIRAWRDSAECILTCQNKIEELKRKAEAERMEKERQAEAERLERERQAELARMEAEKQAKRKKKIAMIVTPIVGASIAFVILLNTVIIPNGKYNDAVALMDAGQYAQAMTAFQALDGYKDSVNKIEECNTIILDGKYNDAMALMNAGKYDEAMAAFGALDGYKDSINKIEECNTSILDGKYNDAIALMDTGKYTEAISAFEWLDGYKDSINKIEECNTSILDGKYNDAIALMDTGKYTEAISAFEWLNGYRDSELFYQKIYDKAVAWMEEGNYAEAYLIFSYNENDNNAKICKAMMEGRYKDAVNAGLKQIIIPDGVTSIDSSMFEGCESLTSITIPDGVWSIGNMAFYDCDNLTSITIPNSITSIGSRAFAYCDNLKSITISSSVRNIGVRAFAGCKNLESITIPNSITNIGSSMFEGCESLTSITIPNSVTNINYEAFYGCSSLKSITIPDSVTSIRDYIFRGCASLQRITYTGTKAQWNAIKKGADWDKNTGNYTIYCTDGNITE